MPQIDWVIATLEYIYVVVERVFGLIKNISKFILNTGLRNLANYDKNNRPLKGLVNELAFRMRHF